MSDEQTSPEQARDMLESAKSAASHSAGHLTYPWWYSPVLGGALAIMMVAHALPTGWNVVATIVGLGITIAVLAHYRAQPAWVNGWRRGKTLYVSIAFLIFYVGLYAFSYIGFHLVDMVWAPPVSAVLIFIGMFVYNAIWLRIWRAETGGSAGGGL